MADVYVWHAHEPGRKVHRTIDIGGCVLVDVDEADHPIGVEVLDAGDIEVSEDADAEPVKVQPDTLIR